MKNIKKPYFIAETAYHHEGDIEFLNKLVLNILDLEVDAIKFHLLFDTDDYIIANHSAIGVIRKICIPESNWDEIFDTVKKYNKDIIALTNDVKSLKYINNIQNLYPIEAVEIHSTGLNDLFLLQESLNFNKTIILGIGGSTFDEIQFAVDFLKKHGKNDILLMHGFQNYPTNYEDINFARIKIMQDAFDLPIGYADHTDPNDKLVTLMSVFPISLGVKIFEKHVTNVFGEKRIDSQAAISLDMMTEVIELGNVLYKTLGKTNIQFSDAELNYGNTGPMKKAIVAREKIEKGKIIKLDDIAYKRTEVSSMLQQKDILKLIGSIAKNDIQTDELITFDNVEYQFKSANFDQFFIK